MDLVNYSSDEYVWLFYIDSVSSENLKCIFWSGRGHCVPGVCAEQGKVQWSQQELPQRQIQRRLAGGSLHQQTPVELHYQVSGRGPDWLRGREEITAGRGGEEINQQWEQNQWILLTISQTPYSDISSVRCPTLLVQYFTYSGFLKIYILCFLWCS